MQPVQASVARPSPSSSAARRGYVAAWEYVVRPACITEFERIYGSNGEWVRLFRRAPGYQRSELHRDRSQPKHFLTLDFWESREACERFKAAYAAEYEALDTRCETLTEREREIGRFEPVDLG